MFQIHSMMPLVEFMTNKFMMGTMEFKSKILYDSGLGWLYYWLSSRLIIYNDLLLFTSLLLYRRPIGKSVQRMELSFEQV